MIDDGVIANYQILTPSTWNASPMDPWASPGPYEEAVQTTPILENFEKPEDSRESTFSGTIRSFDPCMPCTTHIHTDAGVISPRGEHLRVRRRRSTRPVLPIRA